MTVLRKDHVDIWSNGIMLESLKFKTVKECVVINYEVGLYVANLDPFQQIIAAHPGHTVVCHDQIDDF